MKYSYLITAWKEPISIKENLIKVLEPAYENLLPSMEILLACPDDETALAAREVIDAYKFGNFTYIKDPGKGKPNALNLLFSAASGEVLICTDGDVTIDTTALPKLVHKLESRDELGAVTGRPVSADRKNSMFGYWGNLLVDGAHKKRSEQVEGKSSFILLSGYLYAVKRLKDFKFDLNALDDDYITAAVLERGYRIGYEPEARVFVKLPQNFSDWIKQKRRNLSYTRVPSGNVRQKRTFSEELKFIFFPLTYAQSIKELFYSLLLYPARLWLWFTVWYQNHVQKKSLERLWQRIESTK